MPWCPKCKYEFREGITTCSDCGCELVDDLSLLSKEDSENDGEVIDPELLAKAEEFVLEYEDEETLIELSKKISSESEIYINNEERAQEHRSSAYTLLIVGGLGIILIILFFFGILPINIGKSGKYMITGVMGSLFVLFFVMGIMSLKSFKIFKDKAYSENNLTEQIRKWCFENLTPEIIDSNFDFSDTLEELKYFQRSDFIKQSVNNQFMNLNESYVNRLVDEIYPEIFEDKEN